jgi:hypothetical protein
LKITVNFTKQIKNKNMKKLLAIITNIVVGTILSSAEFMCPNATGYTTVPNFVFAIFVTYKAFFFTISVF